MLIAIGSNRRHGRHGAPEGVVRAAVTAMAMKGLRIVRVSTIHRTSPLGPGGRRFANAAAMVATAQSPLAVLVVLKAIEADFGRRGGRRWGDRVLDLDLIAAGAQEIRAGPLQLPHPRLADRRFVLDPLLEIAADWRHPLRHATVRQLRARAMRPKARVHVGRCVGP